MGAWVEALARPVRGARLRVWLGCVLLAGALAVALSDGHAGVFTRADAGQYVALARAERVIEPFASRRLAPLLARQLARVSGQPVETGFVVEGVLSLTVLLGVVFWFALRAGARGWLLACLVVLPVWGEMFHGLALPDLCYAALLCGLLVLLHRGQLWWAAAVFLPLMLTRESTVLTLLCLLGVGWRRIGWGPCILAVVASVAGAVVVGRMAHGGNSEGVPQAVYLLVKAPWNLMRNVLGLQPWSNVYPYPTCAVPAWQMPLRFGGVHSVGFCRFSWVEPVEVLRGVLVTFGLMPLLALRVLRRPAGLMQRFSVVFGVVSFCVAPALGAKVYRLLGYGWPLFAVGVPGLLREQASGWGWFLGLHCVLCFCAPRASDLVAVSLGLGCWALGSRVLRPTSRHPGT